MGAKPRTIKAEVCGPEGWWGRGGRRSVFPWKFGGIPANFVSIGCKKLLLTFGRSNTATVGGERGRRSAAQKQQQAQAAATQATKKTAQATESGAKQQKQQPRNSEGCPAEGGPAEGPRRLVGWAPELLGPEGGRRVGGPKFRAFFFPFRHMFHSFFLSWVSFRGILVFSKAGTLKCAHLEFSGCRVKPRRRGLHGPKNKTGATKCPEEQPAKVFKDDSHRFGHKTV